MNYFLKVNKSLFTYTLITLIVIPIFGINFFISFLGNILLLLFLIPLLFLLVVFIGFNSYKSKIADAEAEEYSFKNQLYKKPSESTIEVQAEEIK